MSRCKHVVEVSEVNTELGAEVCNLGLQQDPRRPEEGRLSAALENVHRKACPLLEVVLIA